MIYLFSMPTGVGGGGRFEEKKIPLFFLQRNIKIKSNERLKFISSHQFYNLIESLYETMYSYLFLRDII